VASGKLGMGSALVGVHGSAFVLALGLIWWREHPHLRLPWRRVPASPVGVATA
jgi:lipopolysaccharide export system permease protein